MTMAVSQGHPLITVLLEELDPSSSYCMPSPVLALLWEQSLVCPCTYRPAAIWNFGHVFPSDVQLKLLILTRTSCMTLASLHERVSLPATLSDAR